MQESNQTIKFRKTAVQEDDETFTYSETTFIGNKDEAIENFKVSQTNVPEMGYEENLLEWLKKNYLILILN